VSITVGVGMLDMLTLASIFLTTRNIYPTLYHTEIQSRMFFLSDGVKWNTFESLSFLDGASIESVLLMQERILEEGPKEHKNAMIRSYAGGPYIAVCLDGPSVGGVPIVC
jgi:hypothetical protein